jgi:hypothetical protein
MPLEDSPKVEQYSNGIPDPLPDRQGKKKQSWTVIWVLAALAVVLAGVLFFRSDTFSGIMGVGVVNGQVIDQTGKPVQAQIMIEGTQLTSPTDVNGQFSLANVPAGDRLLVAGYQGMGFEVPVQIPAGGTVNVGQVRVSATAEP